MRWASSGAMALTGRADGPALGVNVDLIRGLDRSAANIVAHAASVGRQLVLDPLQVLGERAAVLGFTRRGTQSCGGSTRLLPTTDGWIAISLPRTADLEAVPAWLERPLDTPDPWGTIGTAVGKGRAAELVHRASLFALPAARLSESSALAPVSRQCLGRGMPKSPGDPLIIVDLSSLWAGPLCAQILREAAGARVLKVESSARPDGTRSGHPGFFNILHAGKESVALNLRDSSEVARLDILLRAVDIVIESSRARALRQLGIVAEDLVAEGHPRVWLSITGYGRDSERVAFGDDAAVAGGLVAWERGAPRFCADAIADPAAGIIAASEVLRALDGGDACLIDVRLAGVAASLASGPVFEVDDGLPVARPRARLPVGRGPRLGEHTGRVLRELNMG